MTDHRDLEQTLLYKLSESGDLALFRHVILFSSLQDSYVPFESA